MSIIYHVYECLSNFCLYFEIGRAVSHQLRVLKDTKLVRFRRDGKTIYYALDDDHVRSILSMGMDHIEE